MWSTLHEITVAADELLENVFSFIGRTPMLVLDDLALALNGPIGGRFLHSFISLHQKNKLMSHAQDVVALQRLYSSLDSTEGWDFARVWVKAFIRIQNNEPNIESSFPDIEALHRERNEPKKDLARIMKSKEMCSCCSPMCSVEKSDGGKDLLKCSRCKTARYCSKECQRYHWKNGHKQLCNSLTA